MPDVTFILALCAMINGEPECVEVNFGQRPAEWCVKTGFLRTRIYTKAQRARYGSGWATYACAEGVMV